MNLKVNCQKQWLEAKQAAAELCDTSLDECITRLITYAMPSDWQIEQARKTYDKLQRLFSKAFDVKILINDKMRASSEACIRANALYRRIDDRVMAASDRYYSLANGGNKTVEVYSDYCKHSFFFCINNEQGKTEFNGGIIFHDGDTRKRHWQIHT